MGFAYCIKCKQKQELKESTVEYASNGHPMEKGTCVVCGTRTTRFLSRDERGQLKEATKAIDTTGEDIYKEDGGDVDGSAQGT